MTSGDMDQRSATISFRQLELYAAVVDLGAIQKAAAACGLSQPAATQALALLADRVGLPLLERGPMGTATTPAGRLFYPHVVRILADAGAAIVALDLDDRDMAINRLTCTQTRTLTLVLETGSLERAALTAVITRGTMQRSAAALERQFGTIFERTPDGTRLTPAGMAFARRVRSARQAVAFAVNDVRAAQIDRDEAIVVGAAQAFGNRLLARVLSELAAVHHDARITVLREGPDELVARLRAGEVDLVVGDIDDPGADLTRERLVATPYFVFARPGHPLSGPGSIAVADLARFDWVGGTPGSVRETVRHALFGDTPPPRMAFAASEGAIVGHLVAGSDRLALMTEHESRCGGLALGKLPFGGVDSGLGIDVVRRTASTPSSLHDEFVDLLRYHIAPMVCAPASDRHRRVA